MSGPYRELKEECLAANLLIPAHRLAVSTFGNVSALDRARGVFAIKPSGMDYADLSVEDIVIVDLDARVVEGTRRPSSDTRTHAVLYRSFAGIGGVCHTHSTYATAWAQAMTPIPVYGTTHADHLTEAVPCTEVMTDAAIQGNYEEETGNQIVRAFKRRSHTDVEMVLVACHGPFTWGDTAAKAAYNSIVLEEMARMALFTRLVNPDVQSLKRTLIDKHYLRKHGKNAYYGQK
ncbi:MAG: L-ribulose-5-phosphate 4-epimerase AraD [Lentisphaerae bacterium]|nr:L-ribulose-5-phosphate 4-epimerase AraD [Lentisphaerota bacterium]